MTTAFIPSPNFNRGRSRPLKWIVWHATESPETEGRARSIGTTWFGVASSEVSAHVVIDDKDVIECVKPGDTAWHCGPNGNAQGYGIEMCGYSTQSEGQWTDVYSIAECRLAAQWIQSIPVLAAIPVRWLSNDQLRAGELGYITHAQVSVVLGGTNHTDPGPHFPFDTLINLISPTYLHYGMSNNPRIASLQTFLHSYFPSYAGTLPSTGNYLSQTQAVIAEFQRRVKLTGRDGSIIDAETLNYLRQYGWHG